MNTRALLLALMLTASTGFAQVPFPGDDSDHGVTRPPPLGEIINPYTGNASFAVRDLVVAGAVGKYGLVWARDANSRTSQNESFFGLAHNWTHSWQWEMVDDGSDNQGRAVISVREPTGWVHRFTETSPGQWWSAPSVRDRVVSDGDTFRLFRFDASEVQFTRQQNASGMTFAATEVIDFEGNVWKLVYEAGRLVQVTEPAGRWLKVTYAASSSPAAPQGAAPFTVITQVAASNGQVVTYNYAFPDGVAYPVLTGVAYSDGTQASYSYAAPRPRNNLLLSKAVDPHASQAIRGRVFHYISDAAAASGQVAEICTTDNGPVQQALGSDGKSARGYTLKRDNGATVYRTYNPGGNVAEEIDALGFAKRFDYDAYGRGYIVATTDELGRVTRRENGVFGMAVKQTWADGSTRTWTRDNRGRLLSETDQLGNTRTYVRDAKGHVVKVRNPDGTTDQTTYNAFGQILTRKGQDGAVTTMTYDERGLLLRVRNALGYSTSFAYDAQDCLAAITDPRGNANRYVRDSDGRLIETTYADGKTATFRYDSFGKVTETVDATGVTRTMDYDVFGRPISTSNTAGGKTTNKYADLSIGGAPFDRPVQTISPSGRAAAMTYDANDRLTARTIAAGTPEGVTSRYSYDAVGNVGSMINPQGNSTQFFYDSRNRRIKMMNALNYATTYTYDAAGRKLSETNAKGNTTKWAYDAMGRELTKIDANGQTTTRAYDSAGRLTAFTDPRGNVYSFEYDLLGLQTALDYPDGSRETTTYDAAGNQLTYSNRTGTIKTFTYDSRNHEIHSEWSDGSQTIVKAYDAAGRMTVEDNGVSRISYSYDLAGRLASETQDLSAQVTAGQADPAPEKVCYTYNADGRRETLGYPDGTFLRFSYNARGQLQDILGDGVPPPIASYEYDETGNATQIPRENLTETTLGYDAANRITSITDQSAAIGTLSQLDYTYDELTNRASTNETLPAALANNTSVATRANYSYDATDQLIGAAYGASSSLPTSSLNPALAAHSVAFTYDAAGNRLQVSEDGAVTYYSVNNLNQYTQIGSFPLNYDRNGNLASMGQWLYKFDAMNRLISASNGHKTARFHYDARNRCVARSYDGVVTLNYYDGWNLIEERDARGVQIARYVHGGGTDEIVMMANRYGVFYPHHDSLGNVTMLTDTSGKPIERYSYTIDGKVSIMDAAGNHLSASLVANRWMFCGREWLHEVQLYDYRNRIYSAELGRFLQVDPIRFAANDINIYRYCQNNYINLIDPSGLDWQHVTGFIIGELVGNLVACAVDCYLGPIGIADHLTISTEIAVPIEVMWERALADPPPPITLVPMGADDFFPINLDPIFDPLSISVPDGNGVINTYNPDGSQSTTTFYDDGTSTCVTVGPLDVHYYRE